MIDFLHVMRFIGFNGPTFIILISLYFLSNRPSYFLLFITGVLINIGSNNFLKKWIKQPRPDGYLQYIENPSIYKLQGEEYGMPSGHAQLVSYSLLYLLLLGYNMFTIAIVSLFAGITIIQRVLDKKHTPEQILVGIIVGGLISWVLIYCKKVYLRGTNKML